MRLQILVVTLAVWCGSAAPGFAARELQLTVYNNDLGLVRDVRDLEVRDGRSTVAVADVAAQIDPTSVHLRGLEAGDDLTVLEQNYRYDLAGPERILDRYLDRGIQAVLEGGEMHEGTLMSFAGDQLVLRGASGAVSILRRDKIIDLRCPGLPEGLITKPTLVWDLAAKGGGTRRAEITYLTSGIGWHAEYVAVANDDDTQADLSAWVSIDNQSGSDYPDTRLQLIAGDVHRVRPPSPMQMMDRSLKSGMAQETAGFEEETFFEYHLYTLPRPATVRDRETKQIALFDPTRTPVQKLYEYKPWTNAEKVRIVLQFENREDRGLGMPLPAGKVRTYKRDSRGGQQFVGEDTIDHTPKNEKVRLGLGNAFDVVAERTVLDQTRISDRVSEQRIEVKFRNRKEQAVTIIAQDRFWGDWDLRDSSIPGTKKDAWTVEWSVPVAPDAETVLTYTVRIGR